MIAHLTADGQGQVLLADWSFTSLEPGLAITPQDLLARSNVNWTVARVPGTVASSLNDEGRFVWGQIDLDAQDHWFRCQTQLPMVERVSLCFEGLATLALVFWNDDLILSSDNMFARHEVDVSHLSRTGYLSIRFQALTTALAVRRPRPRWRTRLVEHQQLRWIRTSLMGRIPGWAPTAAPVGPFRPIRVRTSHDVILQASQVNAILDGDIGRVGLQLVLRLPDALSAERYVLHVGAVSANLKPRALPGGLIELTGELSVPEVAKWWPHTHGESPRYATRRDLHVCDEIVQLPLHSIGFRHLKVNQAGGSFEVQVNGEAIFCRGACWTPVDALSLNADEGKLRQTLELVRAAGMNMIRVGGTMVYESDAFYDLCDEMGIFVWQDFMFANMDYPISDVAFASSIASEARQFLARVQARPCIAVLCGGSEIEQQAAMLGLPPEHWRNEFFGITLPTMCAEACPQVQYIPSSPSGGTMPFQVDHSVSHYYGVGAYLRPLDDARRSGVRFTSECLGFSNIPEQATVEAVLGNGQQPFHHPVWKQRVPRDSGAGWDFEDVRDHYLAVLFKVDPMRLRYADMERYLAMSRVATAEVLGRTMLEWRRGASSCRGALVWFLRDLWPGAGWGVIDANGIPKAAYFALKRVLAPLAIVISDEGLNGLVLHVFNDGPSAFDGKVSLRLIRQGEVQVADALQTIQVPAHASVELRADAMFQHFVDASYAYRFGPPGHHAAVATLLMKDGAGMASQAFHFPVGFDTTSASDIGLTASFKQKTEGVWCVHLATRQIAQFVHLDVPGCQPSDNYFHLAPGSEREVELVGAFKGGNPKGTISALNCQNTFKIAVSA